MKKLDRDLRAISLAIERIESQLPKLPLAQQIDIGARMRSLYHSAERIDAQIKEGVIKKLKGKDGPAIGVVFKAIRSSSNVTRLDQQKLQRDYPRTYLRCLATNTEARILYHPR